MRLQLDVVEYVLTSKAGLTRRDIRGEERSGYHIERRTDLAATTRRALSRVGRRRVAATVGSCFASIGIATALAGFIATGLYAALVGGVVAAIVYRNAPDVLFTEPDPKATVTKSSTPGMTEAEVYRRLHIHGEREDLKQEKIEKKRKRQERKAKAQGHY